MVDMFLYNHGQYAHHYGSHVTRLSGNLIVTFKDVRLITLILKTLLLYQNKR